MKLTQKITLIVLGFIVQNLAFAHEGLHAAGQVHAGANHMGLFEIALAVICLIGFSIYLVKKNIK